MAERSKRKRVLPKAAAKGAAYALAIVVGVLISPTVAIVVACLCLVVIGLDAAGSEVAQKYVPWLGRLPLVHDHDLQWQPAKPRSVIDRQAALRESVEQRPQSSAKPKPAPASKSGTVVQRGLLDRLRSLRTRGYDIRGRILAKPFLAADVGFSTYLDNPETAVAKWEDAVVDALEDHDRRDLASHFMAAIPQNVILAFMAAGQHARVRHRIDVRLKRLSKMISDLKQAQP